MRVETVTQRDCWPMSPLPLFGHDRSSPSQVLLRQSLMDAPLHQGYPSLQFPGAAYMAVHAPTGTSCRMSTADGAPPTTEPAYLQRHHQQTYQHQPQQITSNPAAVVSSSRPNADSCRSWGHLNAAAAAVARAPVPDYPRLTSPQPAQVPAHAHGEVPGQHCRASWSGGVSDQAAEQATAGPTAGRPSCPRFVKTSQPATAPAGLQTITGPAGTGVAGKHPGALLPGLCAAPINAPSPSPLYLPCTAAPTETLSLSQPPPAPSRIEATTPTSAFSRPPGPPPGYPSARLCDERLFVRKKSSKKDLHRYAVRMYHTWTYGEEEEGSGPAGGNGGGGGSCQDRTLVGSATERPPTLPHGPADGSFSSSTGAAAPAVVGSPTGRVSSTTSCNSATTGVTAAAAVGDANPAIPVPLARGPTPVSQGSFLAHFRAGFAEPPSSGFVNAPGPQLSPASADAPTSGTPRAPTSIPASDPGAFGSPAARLPRSGVGCGGGAPATGDARGHGRGLHGLAEDGSAAQGWSAGHELTSPARQHTADLQTPTPTPMDEQPMTSQAPAPTGHNASAPAAAAAFATHAHACAFGPQPTRQSGPGSGIDVSPFGQVAPPSPIFPSSPDSRPSAGGYTGGDCLLPTIPFPLRSVRTAAAAPIAADAVAFTVPPPYRRQVSDAGYTSAAGHVGPSATSPSKRSGSAATAATTGGAFAARSPGALDARESCSHLHSSGSPAGDSAVDTAGWSPYGAVVAPIGLAAATAGVAAVSVEGNSSTPISEEMTPPPPPPSETQYGIRRQAVGPTDAAAAAGGCSGLPTWWHVDSGSHATWQGPVDGMGPSPAVLAIGRISRPPVTTGAVVTKGSHPGAHQPPPLLSPTWSLTVPMGRSGSTAPEAQGGAEPAATLSRQRTLPLPQQQQYREMSEA